jgi:hypothetical protein
MLYFSYRRFSLLKLYITVSLGGFGIWDEAIIVSKKYYVAKSRFITCGPERFKTLNAMIVIYSCCINCWHYIASQQINQDLNTKEKICFFCSCLWMGYCLAILMLSSNSIGEELLVGFISKPPRLVYRALTVRHSG